MLAEARRVLPDLKSAALQPAGEAGVRRVIEPRFVLFPQPARNDMEWIAWWADYVGALEDIPTAALETAMQDCIRDPDEGGFLPRPGVLRKRARAASTRAAEAASRADAAVRMASVPPPVGGPGRPRVEKARMDALMTDFAARMAENTAKAKAGWPDRRVKP